MHQTDDRLAIERQRVGKDLRLLADVTSYRKPFRTELRRRLMVQARAFDMARGIRPPGARSQVRREAPACLSLPWFRTWPQCLCRAVGGVGRIFDRGLTMRKALAFAVIAVLIMATSTMALVPSVRAQLGKIIATPARVRFRFWTRSGTVSGTMTVALVPEEFTEFAG